MKRLPAAIFLWLLISTSVDARDDRPAPEQDALHCVVLSDGFTSDAALQEILRVELDGLGVRVEEDSAASQCAQVALRRLAEDAAIIEIDDQSRVIDLSTVEESLRIRSLALAVTEELNSISAAAPHLRPAPDPRPSSPVGAPPYPSSQPSETHGATPADMSPAASDAAPGPRLVLAAAVERAFGSEHTLGAGRIGVELDFGSTQTGRWRAGLEGAYGEKDASPFGAVGIGQLGAWTGWNWSPLSFGQFELSALPELALGVSRIRADPMGSVLVTDREQLSFYLRIGLALLMRFHFTSEVALEAGPAVAAFPVPVEVLGENEPIGGLTGVHLGGRLALVLGL